MRLTANEQKLPGAERRAGATVEMEAAAMMAVAEFRGVPFGQLIYAGDDLSGEAWDNRGWQSRREVRQRLFWLAAEAVLSCRSRFRFLALKSQA